MTPTAAQRRRAAKRQRRGARADLDAFLSRVICDACGHVQDNRATLVMLGPIATCEHCGHPYGRYA